MQETETHKGFRITCGKGLQMTFANGWGVSVQFGPGNYTDCEGGRFGDFRAPGKRAAEGGIWAASSAEVAVFVPEARATEGVCGHFLSRITSCDDVAGWVSPDNVAALLATVAGFDADTPDAEARAAVRKFTEPE